jgi:hypothetical protein
MAGFLPRRECWDSLNVSVISDAVFVWKELSALSHQLSAKDEGAGLPEHRTIGPRQSSKDVG